jgi:hypothetical protein
MRYFLAACVVVSCLVSASPAKAQIVNALRGFDDQAMGWSGGVESTVAFAEGNTEYFEIELAGTIQHRSDRNRWRVLGRIMRRTAGPVEIAEDRLGHLRHNYRLLPWLATIAFLQGQHNPFRRIESRILIGGGFRFDVIRAVSWNAAFGATYMYEKEELTGITLGQSEYTKNRLSFFMSVFSAETELVQLDLTAFYQPVIADFSDARASALASMRIDITGGLYFLTRAGLQYDSRPPLGVEPTDVALRSGLGFAF